MAYQGYYQSVFDGVYANLLNFKDSSDKTEKLYIRIQSASIRFPYMDIKEQNITPKFYALICDEEWNTIDAVDLEPELVKINDISASQGNFYIRFNLSNPKLNDVNNIKVCQGSYDYINNQELDQYGIIVTESDNTIHQITMYIRETGNSNSSIIGPLPPLEISLAHSLMIVENKGGVTEINYTDLNMREKLVNHWAINCMNGDVEQFWLDDVNINFGNSFTHILSDDYESISEDVTLFNVAPGNKYSALFGAYYKANIYNLYYNEIHSKIQESLVDELQVYKTKSLYEFRFYFNNLFYDYFYRDQIRYTVSIKIDGIEKWSNRTFYVSSVSSSGAYYFGSVAGYDRNTEHEVEFSITIQKYHSSYGWDYTKRVESGTIITMKTNDWEDFDFEPILNSIETTTDYYIKKQYENLFYGQLAYKLHLKENWTSSSGMNLSLQFYDNQNYEGDSYGELIYDSSTYSVNRTTSFLRRDRVYYVKMVATSIPSGKNEIHEYYYQLDTTLHFLYTEYYTYPKVRQLVDASHPDSSREKWFTVFGSSEQYYASYYNSGEEPDTLTYKYKLVERLTGNVVLEGTIENQYPIFSIYLPEVDVDYRLYLDVYDYTGNWGEIKITKDDGNNTYCDVSFSSSNILVYTKEKYHSDKYSLDFSVAAADSNEYSSNDYINVKIFDDANAIVPLYTQQKQFSEKAMFSTPDNIKIYPKKDYYLVIEYYKNGSEYLTIRRTINLDYLTLGNVYGSGSVWGGEIHGNGIILAKYGIVSYQDKNGTTKTEEFDIGGADSSYTKALFPLKANSTINYTVKFFYEKSDPNIIWQYSSSFTTNTNNLPAVTATNEGRGTTEFSPKLTNLSPIDYRKLKGEVIDKSGNKTLSEMYDVATSTLTILFENLLPGHYYDLVLYYYDDDNNLLGKSQWGSYFLATVTLWFNLNLVNITPRSFSFEIDTSGVGYGKELLEDYSGQLVVTEQNNKFPSQTFNFGEDASLINFINNLTPTTSYSVRVTAYYQDETEDYLGQSSYTTVYTNSYGRILEVGSESSDSVYVISEGHINNKDWKDVYLEYYLAKYGSSDLQFFYETDVITEEQIQFTFNNIDPGTYNIYIYVKDVQTGQRLVQLVSQSVTTQSNPEQISLTRTFNTISATLTREINNGSNIKWKIYKNGELIQESPNYIYPDGKKYNFTNLQSNTYYRIVAEIENVSIAAMGRTDQLPSGLFSVDVEKTDLIVHITRLADVVSGQATIYIYDNANMTTLISQHLFTYQDPSELANIKIDRKSAGVKSENTYFIYLINEMTSPYGDSTVTKSYIIQTETVFYLTAKWRDEDTLICTIETPDPDIEEVFIPAILTIYNDRNEKVGTYNNISNDSFNITLDKDLDVQSFTITNLFDITAKRFFIYLDIDDYGINRQFYVTPKKYNIYTSAELIETIEESADVYTIEHTTYGFKYNQGEIFNIQYTVMQDGIPLNIPSDMSNHIINSPATQKIQLFTTKDGLLQYGKTYKISTVVSVTINSITQIIGTFSNTIKIPAVRPGFVSIEENENSVDISFVPKAGISGEGTIYIYDFNERIIASSPISFSDGTSTVTFDYKENNINYGETYTVKTIVNINQYQGTDFTYNNDFSTISKYTLVTSDTLSSINYLKYTVKGIQETGVGKLKFYTQDRVLAYEDEFSATAYEILEKKEVELPYEYVFSTSKFIIELYYNDVLISNNTLVNTNFNLINFLIGAPRYINQDLVFTLQFPINISGEILIIQGNNILGNIEKDFIRNRSEECRFDNIFSSMFDDDIYIKLISDNFYKDLTYQISLSKYFPGKLSLIETPTTVQLNITTFDYPKVEGEIQVIFKEKNQDGEWQAVFIDNFPFTRADQIYKEYTTENNLQLHKDYRVEIQAITNELGWVYSWKYNIKLGDEFNQYGQISSLRALSESELEAKIELFQENLSQNDVYLKFYAYSNGINGTKILYHQSSIIKDNIYEYTYSKLIYPDTLYEIQVEIIESYTNEILATLKGRAKTSVQVQNIFINNITSDGCYAQLRNVSLYNGHSFIWKVYETNNLIYTSNVNHISGGVSENTSIPSTGYLKPDTTYRIEAIMDTEKVFYQSFTTSMINTGTLQVNSYKPHSISCFINGMANDSYGTVVFDVYYNDNFISTKSTFFNGTTTEELTFDNDDGIRNGSYTIKATLNINYHGYNTIRTYTKQIHVADYYKVYAGWEKYRTMIVYIDDFESTGFYSGTLTISDATTELVHYNQPIEFAVNSLIYPVSYRINNLSHINIDGTIVEKYKINVNLITPSQKNINIQSSILVQDNPYHININAYEFEEDEITKGAVSYYVDGFDSEYNYKVVYHMNLLGDNSIIEDFELNNTYYTNYSTQTVSRLLTTGPNKLLAGRTYVIKAIIYLINGAQETRIGQLSSTVLVPSQPFDIRSVAPVSVTQHQLRIINCLKDEIYFLEIITKNAHTGIQIDYQKFQATIDPTQEVVVNNLQNNVDYITILNTYAGETSISPIYSTSAVYNHSAPKEDFGIGYQYEYNSYSHLLTQSIRLLPQGTSISIKLYDLQDNLIDNYNTTNIYFERTVTIPNGITELRALVSLSCEGYYDTAYTQIVYTVDQSRLHQLSPWSWYDSNHSASLEDTYQAYTAVGGRTNQPTTNFKYTVWNDMVYKAKEQRDAVLLDWDGKYLSYEETLMTPSDKAMTAARYNSVITNLSFIMQSQWAYVFAGKSKLLGERFILLARLINYNIGEDTTLTPLDFAIEDD